MEFLMSLLNQSISPLLSLIKSLMTEPVNVLLYQPFWALMVDVISLFYGLFFLGSGINFIISGYDVEKRERAKMWLRNTVLMILFVQGSLMLYTLIIELASVLTTAVFGLIDQRFFLLTVDSFSNVALQFFLLLPYTGVLILTVILLGLRYVLVALGTVFFPIAWFLYFIPSLESYGKLILNLLLLLIFLPFFASVTLFDASLLLTLPVFSSFKIVLVMIAFIIVDLLIMFMMVFAIIRAALSVLRSDVGRDFSTAAKYLL